MFNKIAIAAGAFLLASSAQAQSPGFVGKDITLQAACATSEVSQQFAVMNGYSLIAKGQGFDDKSQRALILSKDEKKIVIVHLFPDGQACFVDVIKGIEFSRDQLQAMLKTRI